MADALRALLIEDNLADARLLQELVLESRAQLELLHASSLAEGLELLRRGGIDVVLLDLSLPDAHGVETVVRTNAGAPEVAIIVLTGLDDETMALEAMHEGAQDYLVKGQVDGNLLVRAIRYAMERKRADEAARRLIREQAARAAAELSERRSRFLAEASRSLASSLDYDVTLSNVARLAVPILANCCLVDLAEESGRVRRVGAISPDGFSHEQWHEDARERPGPDDPIGKALRSGTPALVAEIPPSIRQALRIPGRWRDVPLRSALIVPLLARHRSLGVMTFLAAKPESYHREHASLARDLAERAALAMDNARLYRAREQILEVVSHDLRTPLTTLLGNIDLIRNAAEVPKAQLELLARAAQHMSRLIEDLLDMFRLDSGTFVLERQPMEVAPLLDEAIKMLGSTAEARDLRLDMAAAPNLPPIMADRRRVLQVLWNLLGNGLKFTPPGGNVRLGALAFDGEIRIEVSDTGPGIPESALPHLFERGWQARRSDMRGAGLGLSISKAIVEAHGGRMGVSSSPAGTTFFFTLPRGPQP
jgi:signal transduction histidine kinase/DNA-binding NarL/FixJ family response regulator